MTRFVALSVVGLLAACNSPDSPPESPSHQGNTVVIRGGWLFDGIHDARFRNTGIVIREGRLVEVGADLAGRSLPGARVIDLDDTATILPGMFDLHAHYNLDLVDEGRVEEVTYNAIIFLANGVTSTWSAGDFFPERVLDSRDRIERGEAIGPRPQRGV
jgi:predicted amidohydrolase